MTVAELRAAVARTGGRLASCHRYGDSDWIAQLAIPGTAQPIAGCGITPTEAAISAVANALESER